MCKSMCQGKTACNKRCAKKLDHGYGGGSKALGREHKNGDERLVIVDLLEPGFDIRKGKEGVTGADVPPMKDCVKLDVIMKGCVKFDMVM